MGGNPMMYRVKVKRVDKIFTFEGTIDKIALEYNKMRESGHLLAVTEVKNMGDGSSVSTVGFEKLILRKIKSFKVNKKFLTRPMRKRAFVISSQIDNGE